MVHWVKYFNCIDLLRILYLSNASVHHQPDPLSFYKPIVWLGNSCLMVQWSDCWCFLLYSSLFAPHTTSEDQTHNTGHFGMLKTELQSEIDQKLDILINLNYANFDFWLITDTIGRKYILIY